MGRLRRFLCLLLLLEFSCCPVLTKKKVVNYEPHTGQQAPTDRSFRIPFYGGERSMEEVLDNPRFRYRKTDLGQDPNLWGDALEAYEKMLKIRDNQQRDRNGKPLGINEPGLFIPWMEVADSSAAKRELQNEENVRDLGLQGRALDQAAVVADNSTDQNTTTTSTSTPTVAKTTPTTKPTPPPPSPTRPPLRCTTNPTRRPLVPVETTRTTSTPVSAPSPEITPTPAPQPKQPPPPPPKPEPNQTSPLPPKPEQTPPPPPKPVKPPPPSEPPVDPDLLFLPDRLMPTTTFDKSVFDDCGTGGEKGKLCFGWEFGCIPKRNCRMFSSLQNVSHHGEDRVRVTLMLSENHMPANPYIALSFSPNQFYGGDDYMFYCINTKKALPDEEKDVALYMSQVGKSKIPTMQRSRSAYLSSVCMIGGYAASGLLGCSFDISKDIEMDDGTVIDLVDISYYQILSFGGYDRGNGAKDPAFGSINKMPIAQSVSGDQITLKKDLAKPKIILPRSYFPIYMHVWLATGAFCFLVPSSAIIAKFGREVFHHEAKLACYKMPKWLLVHIRLNFMSGLMILSSLIVIAIDTEFTWQSVGSVSKLHSIVGLVGMLLLFPGTAVSGCTFNFQNTHSSVGVPKIETRIIAWLHWLGGNLSYFTGTFCIVTAGKMSRALAPCMVEYFGWMHLVLHLGILWFMAVDTYRLVKNLESRYMFQRAVLGPMVPWTLGDIPKAKSKEFRLPDVWKMRKKIVIFHFIISFLCTFAICTLMVLPTVLCREDWEDELIQAT